VDVLNPGKKGDKGKGKMEMNLISHDQIEKSLHEGSTCYALVAREVDRNIEEQIFKHIKPILEEFFFEVSCPLCETFNMLLT